LTEPRKSQARELVSQNSASFDRLFTHSRYYAEFMARYLNLPETRFRTIPLTVDADSARTNQDMHVNTKPIDVGAGPGTPDVRRTTIGYFARICPEKGAFHFLNAAGDIVAQRSDLDFLIAGFLPELHRRQFEQKLQAVQKLAGYGRIRWQGSPADRDQKFRILRSFDWLCVPTEYHEPKGLYVLEAALAGVPALLPNHGAFPERVADLGFGRLYPPGSRQALTDAILNLPQADAGSIPSNSRLRDRCLEQYGMATTGPGILRAFQEVVR